MAVPGTVRTKTRPPGRTSRRPSASQASGANVARDVATSNRSSCVIRQLVSQLLAAASLQGDPLGQLQLTNGRAQKGGLLGDRLAQANHQVRSKQRERQRRKAPPLPTSTRRAGPSSRLARAKASG